MMNSAKIRRPLGVTILGGLMSAWGIMGVVYCAYTLPLSQYSNILTFIYDCILSIFHPAILLHYGGFIFDWGFPWWLTTLVWSALYIVAGIGLILLRESARVIAVILSFIGTVLGIIYTVSLIGALVGIPMISLNNFIMWYLTKEDVASYFT